MNHFKHPPCRSWFVTITALTGIGLAAPAGGAEPGDSGTGDQFPLISCAVTETQLDRKALVFSHQGREIRTCCLDCEDDMKKDFDSWIRKIDDRIVAQQEDYYPLTTCVVDGKSLEQTASLDFVFRNRLFLLCSFECQEKLTAKPAEFFTRLNQAVIKQQTPSYPLTTCIVSGKTLGEKAINHVVGNQLVRLFDSTQLNRFDENPGKYLADLRKLGPKHAPPAAKKTDQN